MLPQLSQLLAQASARYNDPQIRLEPSWVYYLKLKTIVDLVATACSRPFGAFPTALTHITQGMKTIDGVLYHSAYIPKN